METRVYARQDKSRHDELLYICNSLYFFLCKHDRRTPPSPGDHKYSSSALKTNNLIKAECVNYSGGRKRCPLAADASDNTRRACRIPACGPDREFIHVLDNVGAPGIISIFNEWPIQRLAQNTSACICTAWSDEMDGLMLDGYITRTPHRICMLVFCANGHTHMSIHSNYTVCVHFNWTGTAQIDREDLRPFSKAILWYGDECLHMCLRCKTIRQ